MSDARICCYCHAIVEEELPTTCSGCGSKLTVPWSMDPDSESSDVDLRTLMQAAQSNGYRLNIRFVDDEEVIEEMAKEE